MLESIVSNDADENQEQQQNGWVNVTFYNNLLFLFLKHFDVHNYAVL